MKIKEVIDYIVNWLKEYCDNANLNVGVFLDISTLRDNIFH